jgi:hypothetical protein
MTRPRSLPYAGANPVLTWIGLAWKTSEMLMASAQVIHHRTQRLATAGVMPNPRDRREFTLMGQEKVEAMAESAQAVALRIMTLNQQIGAQIIGQMVAGTTALMSLAASRSVAQSSTLQAKLMQEIMASSATATTRLADSVARMAHHGLKPIHSRATANARRLGKLKK